MEYSCRRTFFYTICEHTPVTDRNGTVTKANQPVIERIIRVEKPEE